MKLVILLSCLIVFVVADNPDTQICDYSFGSIIKIWIQMTDPCIKAVNQLIHKKVLNSVQYLALANFHMREDIARPGFAELFIQGSFEDRDSAIKLIDYLLMRGQNAQTTQTITLPKDYKPQDIEWSSLTDAMEYVVGMETETLNITYDVIHKCKDSATGFEDYHVANWFSRVFVYNQLDNLKRFADRASQFQKLDDDHKNMGEFLIDNEMYEAIEEDEDSDWEDNYFSC